MKWLVLGGVTLFTFVAAGTAAPAAPLPLVYKAPPSTQLVRNGTLIKAPSPQKENDLFEHFLEWLKRHPL